MDVLNWSPISVCAFGKIMVYERNFGRSAIRRESAVWPCRRGKVMVYSRQGYGLSHTGPLRRQSALSCTSCGGTGPVFGIIRKRKPSPKGAARSVDHNDSGICGAGHVRSGFRLVYQVWRIITTISSEKRLGRLSGGHINRRPNLLWPPDRLGVDSLLVMVGDGLRPQYPILVVAIHPF